jgi:ADP-heptose:LPS heptosyltransferase
LPRILIIRFSSIGDIVLTSPVIRCLKLQLGAELHFLTKKSFGGILTANPYLDKIHTIEKKVGEVLPTLKALDFDYIIDLHNNIRSRQIRSQLSAQSFSFNKLNIKKWLLVNLKINRLPDIHIVDRYMKATESLGVKNDGKGLDYFIPEETNLPEELTSIDLPFIAFAIGAAHATKRLPREKIISIYVVKLAYINRLWWLKMQT